MISQLFFPIKGILVVYDRETGTYAPLPGADDPRVRAEQRRPGAPTARRSSSPGRRPTARSASISRTSASCSTRRTSPSSPSTRSRSTTTCYRIPFNDGKGGTAEPIEGASDNGMSNYFPKYSPDGKWIVFCKAEELHAAAARQRALHRPGRRAATRGACAYNTRAHELLAQLVVEQPLARVLLEGERPLHAALPDPHRRGRKRHARRCCSSASPAPDRAANIPEFVKLPGDAIAEIREQFLDAVLVPARRHGQRAHRRLPGRGPRLPARAGSSRPTTPELLNSLGLDAVPGRAAARRRWPSTSARWRSTRALRRRTTTWPSPRRARPARGGRRALRDVARDRAAARRSTATSASSMARLASREEALADYRKALELDPEPARRRTSTWPSPSSRRVALDEAEAHYRKALAGTPDRRDPQRPGVRARAARSCGRGDRGVPQSDRAQSEVHARLQQPRRSAGEQGKLEEAATYYRRSLAQKPSPAVYNALGTVLRALGKSDEAAEQFAKAKALASAQ